MVSLDLPSQNDEDLEIAAHNDDEGNEENLSVEDCVIEVLPLHGCETTQDKLGAVPDLDRGGEVLKVVVGGALVKLLDRMLFHPEYDSLGAGEQHGEQPGQHHHEPGPGPLLGGVQGVEGAADADVSGIKSLHLPDNTGLDYFCKLND